MERVAEQALGELPVASDRTLRKQKRRSQAQDQDDTRGHTDLLRKENTAAVQRRPLVADGGFEDAVLAEERFELRSVDIRKLNAGPIERLLAILTAVGQHPYDPT